MPDRERVIKALEICTNIMPNSCTMLCPYKDEKDGTYSGFCEHVLLEDALTLLKEQLNIIRCKDCSNWIPGYITDDDDFIPPKCGKYQQMVGHSADDYCSLAEHE